VGKASKKKAARRAGIGSSRSEIESRIEREQVKRRLTAALRQPGQIGAELRQVAGEAAGREAAGGAAVEPVGVELAMNDAMTGLWGGATPDPAEIPQWADGSLGDFFFTEPVIAGAAAAPPATEARLPSARRLLDDAGAREAVAALLIRAVVFDGLPVTDPAIGVVLERLAPVVEWEVGHYGRALSDAEVDEFVTGPVTAIGSALVEAARAVIADDRIALVLEFLEPVLGTALAPLGLSAELTSAAVARALACGVAHDYLFPDPADTAFLDRLDPESATSENPLETLITDELLTPKDALRTGLAVLAALAACCRSDAASVLPENSQ
jgi:hypothetical protein